MLEIQDYDVMGFRMAIHGMRNAMNSWNKSDSVYFQRRSHKLEEWRQFCRWIEKLPYMKEFISVLDKKEESDE